MKMKLLGVLTAAAALVAWQAQAQNLLTDPSFESAGATDVAVHIASGWGATATDGVPGWFSGQPGAPGGGGTPANSGVENAKQMLSDGHNSTGMDAQFSAFLFGTDGSLNQTSDTQIQSGDSYYLTFLARNDGTADSSWNWTADATLHVELYAFDGTVYHSLYNQTVDLGTPQYGDFQAYAMSIPNNGAIEAYLGDLVGISVWNSSGVELGIGPAANPAYAWASFDNANLVANPGDLDDVPEPGTMVLLTLGGLSALIAMRRRA